MREARSSGLAGSGDTVAPGSAGLLSLAAAPIFAAMAVWNGFFGAQPDLLCLGAQNGSPLGGMTLMYLLMSVFHLAPWLRLLSRTSPGSAGR